MIGVLVSTSTALVLSLLGTPIFIRFLVKRGYGQFIRDDGPTSHSTKRGTPTMGGAIIIGAAILAVAAAYGALAIFGTARPPSISVFLVLFLMTGMGLVGFVDDFIKISKQRSLGLRARSKIIGQGLVGVIFSVLALQFPNANNRTPASMDISFVRDTKVSLAIGGSVVVGTILFIVWANFLITAWSNGVNLTDGLDGLATGASVMVFAGYVVICIWQAMQNCQTLATTASQAGPSCYEVRDPSDLAIVAAAIMGACFGFLWWNASPAKIFMGDTGALALGGAFAGMCILSRTELLSPILGGLFVIITLSVAIQVIVFKLTGKRVFRMAPLQHHFELKGWGEVTIVIRFWIVAGLFAGAALAIFYGEWLSR